MFFFRIYRSYISTQHSTRFVSTNLHAATNLYHEKKTHADIKHQVNINNPVICTNLLVVTPFPFLVRSRAGREHRFWVRLRGRPSGSAAPLGSNLPCLSPWPILKPGFRQPKAPSPPNPGETPLGFVSSQPGRLRRAADDFGAQGGRRGWLAGAHAGR